MATYDGILRQLRDPDTSSLDDASMKVVEAAARAKRGRPPKPKRIKKPAYVRKQDEFLPYEHKFTQQAPCCLRNQCGSMWQHREAEIETFRAQVLPTMSPREKQQAYWEHATTLGSGKVACGKWLKCVYGIRSNDKLYGRKKQGPGEGEVRKSPKTVLAMLQGRTRPAGSIT